MIRLFQPAPAWGVQNLSPACLKLETWLRITAIPYELGKFDLSIAPKGKVPYIEEDGVLMGDSTLIIEHLKNKYNKDPDSHLGAGERAVSLAFRRMLKENTYWAMVYSRYVDDANWALYREIIMPLLVPDQPRAVQAEAVDGFRQVILGEMHGHGLSRHIAAEVYRLGKEDLGAVADYLGAKPFFMGDQVSTADATVFSQVANIVDVPLDTPLKQYGASRQNLVDYLKRMRARFFAH